MEDSEEINEAISMLQSLSLTDEHHRDFVVLKLLLQVKRGNRRAMHQLESRAREFGELLLFHTTALLAAKKLSPEERQNLQQVFDEILPVLGAELVRPHARTIIQLITPQLTSADPIENETARNIVSSLANSVGVHFLIDLSTPDVFEFREQCRLRAVQIFAALASSSLSGVPSVLPSLEAICLSANPGSARETGYKIVQEIAVLNGHAIIPHLNALVKIVSVEMSNEWNTNAWTVRSAALAIDSLARAVQPHGFESLGSAAGMALRCMKVHLARRWMKSVEACARAIVSVIELMEEPMKSMYATELMEIVCCEVFVLESADEELRGVVMGVYKQCVRAKGVSKLDVIRWFAGERVFKSFWAKSRELNHETCSILLDVTVEIARKVGVAEVLETVSKKVEGASYDSVQMLMQIVAKAVACAEPRGVRGNAEFEELVIEMYRLFSSATSS